MKLASRQPTYAWRRGMPVKAEIVGQELEAIQEEHGMLTPVHVVAAARAESSPLHKLFTWDDTKAGELHRQNEARFILRNLRIEYVRTSQADEPKQVRAIVSVPFVPLTTDESDESDGDDEQPERRMVYLSTSLALRNPQQRSYLLAQAKRDLESWRNRYATLKEFDGVVAEIDKALRTLTTEVKAAA